MNHLLLIPALPHIPGSDSQMSHQPCVAAFSPPCCSCTPHFKMGLIVVGNIFQCVIDSPCGNTQNINTPIAPPGEIFFQLAYHCHGDIYSLYTQVQTMILGYLHAWILVPFFFFTQGIKPLVPLLQSSSLLGTHAQEILEMTNSECVFLSRR